MIGMVQNPKMLGHSDILGKQGATQWREGRSRGQGRKGAFAKSWLFV
jgi:hypothetical protein